MTKDQIIAELKAERSKLQHAITVLEGGTERINQNRNFTSANTAFRQHRTHRLTPAGRKRLSEMMKKRCADRRKKLAIVGRKAA